MQVKEFNNDLYVETQINIWLKENKDKKIIDIKYSADQHSSNGLIIYEEDIKSGK
ncbi:sporulation protein Cse60 [Clostridium botulinum]|uniref:Sporulation protein Cse60 n=1 Tax=Clostridium botulinum TaxID=1491 RepID=A0A6B4JHP7_CLOBO|nr:sporulation protein Cse60 [Clostridium botulinum]EES50402.1 hypothetical protein CLO_0508 [Clostridium botulinum E1 str. 'BoNT E Beluga']MBY6759697.1 sporulation protein Cse60 [Clostridium botulinum]MBY6918605.1 sporulation protein Cse60 [Clostridium botulinum]MCR1129688.1 sporulation protein Cse60 [Clostridium botulinum]NFJ56421.1 sporulation protein Cse60 [Clostridium botulinum]